VKQLKITVSLLLLLLPRCLTAGALDEARKSEKIYLSVAVRAEALPTGRIGSGFLSKVDRDDSKVMFTTTRHLVDGASILRLTVPTKDTASSITGVLTFNIPFFKDSLNQTHIPQGNLDLALIIIDKAVMTTPGRESELVHFSSLPFRYYADSRDLFAGQAVLFSGYPLGLSVNGNKPLLRKGSIAGIDTTRDIIYLDADAFGGSSGSPVFIDFSSQANVQFFQTYEQMLVGMISGYLFEKRPLSSNSETENIGMVQEENTGIAVVIPAETIRRHAESFLAKKALR
jgi:hypothetical protein